MPELDIAFSPCPNDTFIFHALLHGRVDTGHLSFAPHIADVEELNRLASSGTYHITKLSYYAYLLLKDRYALLDSGSALGYGCGPMLVARNQLESLDDATIAVPGAHTTACLLLKLWRPDLKRIEVVRFDQILPGIAAGAYDAGLIIHEGRFIYPRYNCIEIIDLGKWWEEKTGLPIPLGCIAVRRDKLSLKPEIESMIRDSVRHAQENPEASRAYVRSHAQELDDGVIADHISLYVNDFTLNLGKTGMEAIKAVKEMARRQGLL